MAGFFGLEWTNNVTLEVIIEGRGFNNSLVGYDNCNNSYSYRNMGGINATKEWTGIYLKNATQRLQSMIEGFDWTVEDTYAAQTMCSYETVMYHGFPACDCANNSRLPMATVRFVTYSRTKNGLTLSTPGTFTSLVVLPSSRLLGAL